MNGAWAAPSYTLPYKARRSHHFLYGVFALPFSPTLLYNATEQIQRLHHVCIPFTRLYPFDLTHLLCLILRPVFFLMLRASFFLLEKIVGVYRFLLFFAIFTAALVLT